MDPLVRATLAVQKGLSRAWGTTQSALLGAYVVYAAVAEPPAIWNYVALGALVLALSVRLVRRLYRLMPEASVRVDLELFTTLTVAGYAAVSCAPGGLSGPLYPVLYATMMLAAAFSRPAAAIGTLLFALAMETALTYALGGSSTVLVFHAVLLLLFTVLNLLVFRAEIARVRRLSRARIESEIQRMKEAARSYRLLTAPRSATERNSVPNNVRADDEERLLRSGVEEIHEAIQFALELLRASLSLRTAVILWLDAAQEKLSIQELSSEVDAIAAGPFAAQGGIFGAALAQGAPVTLVGPKAAGHAVYYGAPQVIGAICAVPVLDHGQPRGLLVVDREVREPFTKHQEELLLSATRFALRAIENERVFIQLERAKLEQSKLYRASENLAASVTEAQVIEAGVSSAREFAAFDFAAVTLFDKASAEHEICAASGDDSKLLVGMRFKHNAGLVSMVVANRHPLPYRGDYDPSRQIVFTRRLSPPRMPSLLVLPLMVHERPLGTIVLGSKRKNAFGDSVRPTLEVLASHIAVSLANARMVKRLEELATTDGLTGLLNKRALTELAAQKLKSALRFKKPLSVLVCDIDHFKRVNDTYGHDVGDHVIRGFAEVFRRVKRDTDVVARFGGEEFVLVCEETDGRGAELLAERIRAELESTTFHTPQGSLQVTCSVGVATCPLAGEVWEALFKATDEALYVSKRSGRNKVTVWTPKISGVVAA
jgi:two-component system, cell cycle response regulator